MLTLQFVPYADIEKLSPEKRIKKLIEIVRGDRILLLEGRLSKEEETGLIRSTMESINGKFRGIELLILTPDKKNAGFIRKLQNRLVEMLSGTRQGLTIIGPATIVKEIKKDPDKIQLLTIENGKRRKSKKNLKFF